ncbi:MAG TPA: hypothetical protein VGK74_12650 [Symbiobacteriaceae bacterium]|jgi:hypothetical protein
MDECGLDERLQRLEGLLEKLLATQTQLLATQTQLWEGQAELAAGMRALTSRTDLIKEAVDRLDERMSGMATEAQIARPPVANALWTLTAARRSFPISSKC